MRHETSSRLSLYDYLDSRLNDKCAYTIDSFISITEEGSRTAIERWIL